MKPGIMVPRGSVLTFLCGAFLWPTLLFGGFLDGVAAVRRHDIRAEAVEKAIGAGKSKGGAALRGAVGSGGGAGTQKAQLKLPKGQRLVGPSPSEVYDGPFKANAQNVWNYQDHGVSWSKGKCSSNKDQSPIELPATGLDIDPTREIYYRYNRWESPVELYNDGVSLSIDFHECVGGFGVGPKYLEGGGLDIEESYALSHIQFHTPSEHMWGGEHVGLEVQLVHRKKGAPNSLGIIAIPFQQGLANAPDSPFLTALLEVDVPALQFVESQVNARAPHSLDFEELVGQNTTYYVYDGSVTVPDCETNARWFVKKERTVVNPRQVDAFYNAIYQMTDGAGNNRVVQKLQDRKITVLVAQNGATLPTQQELFKSMPAPALQAIKPEDMDPDHEDAMMVAPRPEAETPDENTVKQQKIKETYRSNVPEEIRKAWDDDIITQDPDRIINADPAVIETGKAVEEVKAKYDEAALMAEESCKGLEDAQDEINKGGPAQATSQALANAQFKGCETARGVAKTEHDGLLAKLKDYNAAFGRAAAGVKEAQKYIKIDEERSFNQTQLPKHERSMQPIPEGRMDTSYVPPSGDVLDPFNFACSEDTSRINPQHPLFAEHMSANMRQPSLPGTNTIEATPLAGEGVPE